MKLYDKAEKDCKYGSFDMEHEGGYLLTAGDKLKTPWYYIYNNRKLLLYVDQNGPVKLQYQPPNGILVFKREMGENQSKWQTWIQARELNGGIPISNFNSPVLRHDAEKPVCSVQWLPERAVYTVKADKAEVVTELFMPHDQAGLCMKTTIVNTSDDCMDFTVTPAVFPYINEPQMVAWDLPEWYLATSVKGRRGDMFTIHGQMNDPGMDEQKRRSVTYHVDYEENAEFELNMADFTGSGNFFAPEAVIHNHKLSYRMSEDSDAGFAAFQAVYAVRYRFSLQAGERKTLTQMITVQESTTYSEEECLSDLAFFEEASYQKKLEETRRFYAELFHKRRIKTENALYDQFINSFAPLQMYWVSSLDRGWPSSMRGIRDASQDFVGMLPLDPTLTRQTILDMLKHQQRDGWMPRQISTISRKAPHDMRYFCDGGAFLLELFHEYMTFTRDVSILREKLVWLDSDEESDVLTHILRCTEFYLEAQNIGEHGLCKVWYGDWWDVMDKIGMEGRGETVTVTAQMILNLKNLSDMFQWLHKKGHVDESCIALAERYLEAREAFIKAMKQHAYNKAGYFNGYFNDNGKWLLSDEDPDGKKRMYLVSNAWALIAGICDKEMQESILKNIEEACFGRMGYNTNSLDYKEYVDKAGRVGSGTRVSAAPYNHAQSFLVRACCACGHSEMAYKATRYILPIEEAYAPVEKTFAPPYAIANCYSNSEDFPHRVELQFLSGTVSYVLRTVYQYFFGITPGYEGLTLRPCLPESFGACEVEFAYLDKRIHIHFTDAKEYDKVIVNGQEVQTGTDPLSGKLVVTLADELLLENTRIIIE